MKVLALAIVVGLARVGALTHAQVVLVHVVEIAMDVPAHAQEVVEVVALIGVTLRALGQVLAIDY